jgi:hypothetical protein
VPLRESRCSEGRPIDLREAETACCRLLSHLFSDFTRCYRGDASAGRECG